jgi:hypothetical protein
VSKVVGFLLMKGAALLLTLPHVNTIRDARNEVLRHHADELLRWFDGRGWFEYSAGPAGKRRADFYVAPAEKGGLLALKTLINLDVSEGAALACAAVLLGVPTVNPDSRRAMLPELQRFRIVLAERATEARKYADQAARQPAPAPCEATFDDV